MSHWYRHRCCICGRFCKWDADNSTPFGDSSNYEPPEPNYYCERCAEAEKQYHIEARWLPTNWVPAHWEYEAAAILKMGRAGMGMNAWDEWAPIDKLLPEGWEWRWRPDEPFPWIKEDAQREALK